MSTFHKPIFKYQARLGLAFCLSAVPMCAQEAGSAGSQSPLSAQTGVRSGPYVAQVRMGIAASEAGAQSSESRIGPDDLLDITIFEAPDLNRTVRVSTIGEISLPLLGEVKAAGLTPSELELFLQKLLRGTYMQDPHVGVFVRELESHPVSVVGAVKQPGVFQIRGTKSVIEMISMAQGLTEDAGETVIVMRRSEVAVTAYAEGQDAPDAGGASLALTYGESARDADPPPTPQREKGEIEEINLKKLLDSDNPDLNVPVRPGDIVKVSRAGIVYVVGEVRKPGGFVLQNNENISVLQALALAEGPTHTSELSHARVIRTNSITGKHSEIPMDLGRILSGKSPDSLLEPKDIVYVPNSAAKSVFYRGAEIAVQTAAGVAIYRF